MAMYRRESKERERGRCFAKQLPHERNNHLMRQLHNYYLSCCCHATHKNKYIGTRQQSHRSSHAVPHMIFDDVEEREQGERKRSLPRETTTS
jgi:hypothetical protein